MTNQTPPEVKNSEMDYSKLDMEGMKEHIAKFQEALKSDQFKEIDLAKSLGVKAPEAPAVNVEEQRVKQETIDRVLPAFTQAKEELITAGFSFKEAKMSEAEKDIYERLEQQAQAKFSEQKIELSKIDDDFDASIIESIDAPTEAKIQFAIAQRNVLSKNQEAVEKIKDELTKVTKELEEVKMSSPSEETKEPATGESIVSKSIAKFGLDVETTKDKDE